MHERAGPVVYCNLYDWLAQHSKYFFLLQGQKNLDQISARTASLGLTALGWETCREQ